MPILTHFVPDRCWWKEWLPSPILLGVAGLYSGVNFMCITMLIIALVYQVWLRRHHPEWLRKYQHVSTAGVNAGAGIAGLLVVLFTYMELPSLTIGPQPTGSCANVNL